MLTRILTSDRVLDGYDHVCRLYPHVPPLSLWRAWEFAAYRGYRIDGRILDLGCGDGQYFRLIWPQAGDVVGVDRDPAVVALAEAGGVYSRVHLASANRLPEPDASFDHVFANCSLEHMDALDEVLGEVSRCLRPRGSLVCSVVTQRFNDWALLPKLVELAGFSDAAQTLRNEFADYHHLVNPLALEQWAERFAHAGLTIEEHVPILPRHTSGLFLLMDNLWHVKKRHGGELGDDIFPFLSMIKRFPAAFRQVFAGILDMESDWTDCSGAVFLVRKHG